MCRVRFTSCGSKQLLALSRSGRQLWSDMHIGVRSPEQLHSLAAFLRRRAAVLAGVSIWLDSESLEMRRELQLLLGGLAGSSLHRLGLDFAYRPAGAIDPLFPDSWLYVGGWLDILPRLRALVVVAEGMRVEPSLSRLTGLSSLDLEWLGREPYLELPAACLPSSLVRLDLHMLGDLDLQAAGQLPLLEQLNLSIFENADHLPTGVVSFLHTATRLTDLTLRGFCAPLEGGLGFLAALTNLRELVVEVYTPNTNQCSRLPWTCSHWQSSPSCQSWSWVGVQWRQCQPVSWPCLSSRWVSPGRWCRLLHTLQALGFWHICMLHTS